MNHFIRDVLAEDCRTEAAYDGASGLELALQRRPALIISDVVMPGMTGEQLVGRIRACPELEAVPVLLLTGKTSQELHARWKREGAQDCLVKPFEPEALRAAVRRWMKRDPSVLVGEN
jgi:DNA-binding response OmpR family regulator